MRHNLFFWASFIRKKKRGECQTVLFIFFKSFCIRRTKRKKKKKKNLDKEILIIFHTWKKKNIHPYIQTHSASYLDLIILAIIRIHYNTYIHLYTNHRYSPCGIDRNQLQQRNVVRWIKCQGSAFFSIGLPPERFTKTLKRIQSDSWKGKQIPYGISF